MSPPTQLNAALSPAQLPGVSTERRPNLTGETPQQSAGQITEFTGVTAHTKANVYFDGRVVSHTLLMPDGAMKTLGVIHPGSFHFGTGAPERMEIVAGVCRVTLDGQAAGQDIPAGSSFDVPGRSGFTIEVKSGLCEYICSFL